MMAEKTPTASNEYDGIHCPACGGDQVSPYDIDGAVCDECGASWTDVYEITGYKNLRVPSKD